MQFQLTHIQFKTRLKNNRKELWDSIRKKYIVITPEELVRQHVVHYLIHQMQVPIGKIAIEKGLEINQLKKRIDILVYNTNFNPLILVECKAPEVPITQQTLAQIATYNLVLQVPYLMITNGNQIHFAEINWQQKTYEWKNQIPLYSQLISST